MKRSTWFSLFSLLLGGLLVFPSAYATNGYFKIGYGSKNRGLAGAGVAFPQDSTASAVNPSGLSFIDNRIDAGVEVFNPRRDGGVDARFLGGAESSHESGATAFLIPHAAMSTHVGGDLTYGFSMTANGGMNTRYNHNIYTEAFAPAIGNTSTLPGGGVPPSGFAGGLEGLGVPTSMIDPNLIGIGSDPDLNPALGVNLAQLIFAPSVSYKLNNDHAVGASLLLGYQRFRAYGLGLFKGLSSDPSNVTDKGDDDAWGAGLRLGWTGRITDAITLGVAASSKIYMQEFDDYAGLFAEKGDFDIPANYAVGIAVKVTPKLTVAVDAQKILYGDVKSISNRGPTADEFLGGVAAVVSSGAAGGVSRPLGTDAGYGFGWDDITVVKVGFNYEYNRHWTYRLGFNQGDNPYDDDQTLFNVLAPGLVKDHVTLGFTYSPSDANEITVTYMHAMREDQDHTFSTVFPGFGPLSYSAENGMDQNALEVAYSWRF